MSESYDAFDLPEMDLPDKEIASEQIAEMIRKGVLKDNKTENSEIFPVVEVSVDGHSNAFVFHECRVCGGSRFVSFYQEKEKSNFVVPIAKLKYYHTFLENDK